MDENYQNVEGVEEDYREIPYRKTTTRRVQTQPYDYAVRSLMDMIVDQDLVLNPDYQRHYRWDAEKASRFIESLILNIPVPVIYLSEEADTSLTVIDGQQRLSALLSFIKPDDLDSVFEKEPEFQQTEASELEKLDSEFTISPLVLTGLKVRSDLNGTSFKELSREDKNALQKRHIRCIVILNESDSMLKYEVFERLNTGSVELSSQEIRNCTYRGSFNKLINKRLVKNEKFKELISLPEKDRKSMKDAELVLRFFAYSDLFPTYNDNYVEYLNEYMEDNRNMSLERLKDMEFTFSKTIELLYSILGPKIAFRRPRNRSNPADGKWNLRSINGAIYESQMIVYSCLPSIDKISQSKQGEVREKTFAVFRDDVYWDAISQGTATKNRVKNRAVRLHDLLSGINDLKIKKLSFVFADH